MSYQHDNIARVSKGLAQNFARQDQVPSPESAALPENQGVHAVVQMEVLNRFVHWPQQVLMKDAKTGKKVMLVPLLSSPSMADSTDPGFIAAVQSNGGRNDIVVQRMCALSSQRLALLAQA